MSDILDTIKEKYLEEVGISFTIFEILTFFIYSIVSYFFFCESVSSAWGAILDKSLDDILLADDSIFHKTRVLDYIIAGALTFITISWHRKICSKLYAYLASLKNMEEYVDRLKKKLKVSGGQAMRIYIANSAKEQKEVYLRKITSAKGIGLVALTITISSVPGLFAPNWIDFVVLISGLTLFIYIQWSVFSSYTSEVVPRLVLEKIARDEEVKFGEDFQ